MLALAPFIVRVIAWLGAFLIVDRIVGLGDAIVEDETPLGAGFGLGVGFGLPFALAIAAFFLIQKGTK